MQKCRRNKGLQAPVSTHAGSIAPILVFIVCCWATVDGLGAGGVMDMQCTDYTMETYGDDHHANWNTRPGQASVWSQTKGIQAEFNDACGVELVNQVQSNLVSVAWNATVPKGEGYQVTLAFDKDSLLQAVGTGMELQAGLRFWEYQHGGDCNISYLATVFKLVGDSLQYRIYGYHQLCDLGTNLVYEQGTTSAVNPIIPSDYCPVITKESALPKEMTVYVSPEGNITNHIKLQNDMELVRTYDYTTTIQGHPPVRVGIETGLILEIDFPSISASFWKPEVVADTTAPLPECNYASKAKGMLLKYFIALASGAALVAVHIVFAYRLVRRNYWHQNKPHPFTLFCTGIAGLDSFGDIAQVFFFWMAYDAARSVASVDAQAAKTLQTYFTYYVVSLVLVLGGVTYNAMVLLYVICTSGRYMNQKLLTENRLFFALQSALTILNLELLPLFPWRYEAFQDVDHEDIKDLEGFPSTRLMVMSVLPIIFVDLPMIVLQALTQSLNTGFGDGLLIAMQCLSALDVMCRFFSRAFITASEVETRKRERSRAFITASEVETRKRERSMKVVSMSNVTASTDDSRGSPESMLSGPDSVSTVPISGGKDMEQVELGRRPASAPTTIDAVTIDTNETASFFRRQSVKTAR